MMHRVLGLNKHCIASMMSCKKRIQNICDTARVE